MFIFLLKQKTKEVLITMIWRLLLILNVCRIRIIISTLMGGLCTIPSTLLRSWLHLDGQWWLMIVIFQLCFKLNQIRWMYSAWIIKYIGRRLKFVSFETLFGSRALLHSMKIGSLVYSVQAYMLMKLNINFGYISWLYDECTSATLWSKSCVSRTKSVEFRRYSDEDEDDRCSFILQTLFFRVLSSKENIYLEFQIFFEDEKKKSSCVSPTWVEESDSRFITRSEEEREIYTYLSTVGSIFFSYIFLLFSKLTQISTDDEYKAPQTWFSS